MAVIGGCQVLELVAGFSERNAWQGGPTATKSYLANWADRYTVANALLGLATYTVSGGGVITLNSPGVYPESTNIFAMDVTIQPVGTPGQGPKQIAWTYAAISVNYGRNLF